MCGTVDIACHVNSESTLEAPDMINDMSCLGVITDQSKLAMRPVK